MRSVTQTDAGNDRTQWNVALVNEVTGIVDVAVNFAVPIDASTRTLKMPAVQTDAPAGYRATVAVQNMSRHEINVETNVNLSELAVSEQQKIMPREMRESLQYVFESFEDDWSLSLGFKPAKTAVRIQAVVDLLELTTVIDRSGRCRYEAKIALQNRSEQFLRIKVPDGLRLWSASVAGQPVKPVMPDNYLDSEVLIPLVKTSPGGLPYDISLYFADDGAEPLVPALEGITRLKPPNISIVGIPVMQTTWSLRLPGGYRYIRPGGNMSPVAGTVEMLSYGIEARLEQLRRLERTYRDVADLSARKQQVAKRNWDVFNQKLVAEIQQVQSYLNRSRSQVGQDDYDRLQTKLSGQRRQQDALLGSNAAFDARQNEQARNDLNVFLNADASNPGVSEIIRNQALLEKPDFLSKSEEQQIARLRQELEVSQRQSQLLEQKADRQIAADQAQKEDLAEAGGTKAGELIAGLKDKDEEMVEELGRLRGRAKAQIDQKQAQIRGQLDELTDNRLQRHFKAQQQQSLGFLPEVQPQRQGIKEAEQYESRFGRPLSGRQQRLPAQPPTGRARVAGPEPAAEKAEMEGLVMGETLQSDRPGSVFGDLQPYTARRVYSLPVTLPAGEVRLDFARPAGEANLTLWAVPLSTFRNLYGTFAVIAGLFILAVFVKIWPRPDRKQPISAKRIFGYTLLFVALALVFWPLGLLVSFIIILLCEARRGVFVSPPIVEAED
jgi:hypothetical protein